jgi:hypothetical protein
MDGSCKRSELYPTSVPVSLLLGKMGSVLTLPGLMMSAQRRPSAQPMRMSSMMKRVVVSVKYCCSPAVYQKGVLRTPILVRNSGMKMPAAPSIAHRQCTSSACTFHRRLSGSDPAHRVASTSVEAWTVSYQSPKDCVCAVRKRRDRSVIRTHRGPRDQSRSRREGCMHASTRQQEHTMSEIQRRRPTHNETTRAH